MNRRTARFATAERSDAPNDGSAGGVPYDKVWIASCVTEPPDRQPYRSRTVVLIDFIPISERVRYVVGRKYRRDPDVVILWRGRGPKRRIAGSRASFRPGIDERYSHDAPAPVTNQSPGLRCCRNRCASVTTTRSPPLGFRIPATEEVAFAIDLRQGYRQRAGREHQGVARDQRARRGEQAEPEQVAGIHRQARDGVPDSDAGH